MFTDFLGNPLLFLVMLLAMLSALVVHELGHALVAHWQGDSTPQRMGRLTLNPLAHLDVWGTLLLVTVGFGWAKPVPYNPQNLRLKTVGPLLVSLAGPGINLLTGFISMVLLLLLQGRGLPPENALIIFFQMFLVISVALAVFNLLPFPPLDGAELVRHALSHPRFFTWRAWWERYAYRVFLVLIVLDIVGQVGILSRIVHGLSSWVLGFYGLLLSGWG
jgi:Zn-dependent protease